jgi:hypothetical protein
LLVFLCVRITLKGVFCYFILFFSSQDGLEQVLLALCLGLWREMRVHERMRNLRMLQLMQTMMLQEFSDTQLGGAWAFVLRRLIATLLQLLTLKHRQVYIYPGVRITTRQLAKCE